MAEAKLSQRKVDTTKVPFGKEDIYLSDGMGLYLRVYASGSKLWIYRYKNTQGIERFYPLGEYGDGAGQVGLGAARTARNELKTLRKLGKDPFVERDRQQREAAERKQADEQQRLALESRLTLKQLFEEWVKTALAYRPNTTGKPLGRKDGGKSVRRLFEKDVFPEAGEKIAVEVTRGDIVPLLDKVLARGNTRMGAVLFSELRQMFQWGVERELIPSDPTATLKKSKFGVSHEERDRRLKDVELKELKKLLPLCGMTEQSQLALWIQLSTLCRISEVLSARWEHIDFKNSVWFKPSTKNYKSHTVYLSDFAKERFERLKTLGGDSDWVFPSTNKPNTHIDLKTISKQVGDRQRADGVKLLKGRTQASKSLVLSGGRWTPHDLRRTGASICNEITQKPHLVEKMLGHTEQNKMMRTYQLPDETLNLKTAWQALGKRLITILRK